MESEIDEARLESELLLAHAAGLTRTQLLARLNETPGEAEANTFEALLRRRLAHEPLAYIVGRREFFGWDFVVTPDVLIPRPETELLVHEALQLLAARPQPTVLDVGSGSGAIGLSILAALTDTCLIATDISLAALHIARLNAWRLGLADRVCFAACDLLRGVRRPAEGTLLIVANLPYVPTERRERLEPEVRDFEPHVALFSPDGGLEVIGRLLEDLDQLLEADEYALLEIDEEQGTRAIQLAHERLPNFETRLLQDSSRTDRMIKLRKRIST
jgi:release factor glutamine methyltransferase